MNLRRPTRRRRASITSLIDVIFLLLLFFMLTSSFTRFSEIELTASGETAAVTTADAVLIRLEILENGVVLDGAALADDQIAPALMLERKARTGILVGVAQEATTQRLVDILSIIGALPGSEIQLVEAL
ncbi:biopolymer transporter ExbD [Parvularcula flava]|uniref:Biopolymer transporter ExbD n=1 Tax=Aquisalinus luteolus TaxID=1566827 RepID=A0A8J3A577_9PROT|nr:biopolymer transporter ExbD [Aquisalinus luteolus]NHK27140.1 biopolymer transporter ExbD [Aquisalinus luteolus]GGH94521.1 hypothetical protein GCM10011355_08900 [Aquisalinus luteolus]